METKIIKNGSEKQNQQYYCDDGQAEIIIEAYSPVEAAREYVRGGEWGDSLEPVRVLVWAEGEEREDGEWYTIPIEPDEPECEDGEDHIWTDDGVVGHGGGIIQSERCQRCGLVCTTDTYATARDGSHYTSVRYHQDE
ncbi:MAG: hypothetical protein WC145_13460 [Aliarcobacter sp.]|jgi:hypothetical protein